MKKLISLLLTVLILLSAAGFVSCRTGVKEPSPPSPVPDSQDTGNTETVYDTLTPLELVTDDTDPAPSTDESLAETDTTANSDQQGSEDPPEDTEPAIDEFGTYDDKDSVALYIHTYGKLPSNYISKKDASDLGWTGGSVEQFVKGMAIGGDRFGNYEGKLPKASGRVYYECDIDTIGRRSRGAKRIIYSNDGLIYYTDDHYETFELLYPGESD